MKTYQEVQKMIGRSSKITSNALKELEENRNLDLKWWKNKQND